MTTHIVHADPTLTGANQVEDDESGSLQQTSTSYVESGDMQLSQAEVIVDDTVEMSRAEYAHGALGVVVYSVVDADYKLTPADVEAILEAPDMNRLATHPPLEPAAGQLYLYDISADPKELRQRYRRDMFQWHSFGCRNFKSEKMRLKVNINYVRVNGNAKARYSKAFARYEYWNDESPQLMLVQYCGDSTPFVRKRLLVGEGSAKRAQLKAELPTEGYPPFEAGTVLGDGCILYDMHQEGPNAILTHEEANDILCNPDLERLSTEPPVTPIGGMMFLYDISSNPKILRAQYRCDQYQFVCRGCRLNLQHNIVKGHHYIKTGSGRTNFSREFARFEYWSPEREDFMLVHYVGNHNVWVPRAHGNAKKTSEPFVRTQPAILHAIKMHAPQLTGREVFDNTMRLVTKSLHSDGAMPASKVPRNVTQVMNHRRGIRRASNYTSSGTISVEQQPTHYILDDGSTVPASSLIRLSDGTYAIIEDASEGEGAMHTEGERSATHASEEAKVTKTIVDAKYEGIIHVPPAPDRTEDVVYGFSTTTMNECDAAVAALEPQVSRLIETASTSDEFAALMTRFASVLAKMKTQEELKTFFERTLDSVTVTTTPEKSPTKVLRSSTRTQTKNAEHSTEPSPKRTRMTKNEA